MSRRGLVGVMKEDTCVTIPLRVAAIVGLWVFGVGLIGLQTLGYAPPIIGRWGGVMCMGGTMLACIHTSTRHHRMLRQSFELGQETERAKVSALR